MTRTNPNGRMMASTDAKTHEGTLIRLLPDRKFQMSLLLIKTTLAPNCFEIEDIEFMVWTNPDGQTTNVRTYMRTHTHTPKCRCGDLISLTASGLDRKCHFTIPSILINNLNSFQYLLLGPVTLYQTTKF